MKALEIIKYDLFRYCGSNNFIDFVKSLRYQGFVYMIFLRLLQNTSFVNPLWFLWRFFLWFFSYRFGFQIPSSVKIGPGLLIAHFGTVIINSKTKIGRNCNISPNVVIGQTNRGEKIGTPELGDSVWIGVGAVIVGGIKIGNNVLIGPNSYVNFDVPSNSIVTGNPAQVKSSEYATKDYINFTV